MSDSRIVHTLGARQGATAEFLGRDEADLARKVEMWTQVEKDLHGINTLAFFTGDSIEHRVQAFQQKVGELNRQLGLLTNQDRAAFSDTERENIKSSVAALHTRLDFYTEWTPIKNKDGRWSFPHDFDTMKRQLGSVQMRADGARDVLMKLETSSEYKRIMAEAKHGVAAAEPRAESRAGPLAAEPPAGDSTPLRPESDAPLGGQDSAPHEAAGTTAGEAEKLVTKAREAVKFRG